MALATLFYGCENDAHLDTFEGATLLDASYVSGAPCDNSTNPACAFVEDIDYITAAPIIAERALRLCPTGFNCILTPKPNTRIKVRYCSISPKVPNGNCDERILFYGSPEPIISANDLNNFVCSLSGAIRAKISQGYMPIIITIDPRQDIAVLGESFFYHVATVDYDKIDREIIGDCF